MSYRDDQPDEVEFREVVHEFGEDYDEGAAYIAGVGTVRDWEWWGGHKRQEEFERELAVKEQSRAKLNGFGFRIERANG